MSIKHFVLAHLGLLGTSLFLAAPVLGQTVHKVPEHFPSVQAAIDAALTGDTIDVGPGRYIGGLSFRGKDLIVRSRGGAGATTLDSLRMGSVVVFDQGEGPGAVLEGFTVLGGSASFGGGIHIAAAAPTIRSCVIRSNHGFEGGGLYAIDSAATIEGCFFYDNWAFHTGGIGGLGAAIYCERSPLVLNHVSVTRNNADYIGDGLFITGGSPVLTNCVFHTGADIHVSATASPTIQHCVLDGPWPGAGNQWADPKFVDDGFWDPHNPDMHLRHDSPCIGAGMAISGAGEVDGDPRDTNPDIGADEFLVSSHWYTGDPVSFGTLQFNASGDPGDWVFWLIAGDMLPAPVPTMFGGLYLDLSLLMFDMSVLGPSGIVEFSMPMPWLPPVTFYSQVLVGTNPFEFSLPRSKYIGGV